MNQKNNLIIGLIIAGVVIMSANVDADPRDFVEGLPNIGIMLQEITEVDSSLFVTAFWSMLETIEMAFIGTVVGVAIALPLSLLSARNLNNKFVYVPVRALLASHSYFPFNSLGNFICNYSRSWSVCRCVSNHYVHSWIYRKTTV